MTLTKPNDIFYLSQRLDWATPVSPVLAFLSLMTGIYNVADDEYLYHIIRCIFLC